MVIQHKIGTIFILFVVIISLVTCSKNETPKNSNQQQVTDTTTSVSDDDTAITERYKVNNYEIVLSETPSYTWSLEIYRDSQVVYSTVASWLSIFLPKNDSDTINLPVGTDLTGDGVPDLAVTSSSGGAHCCKTLEVLQLGKELQIIDQIDLQNTEVIATSDMNHNGAYELHVLDWAFAYWYTCYASSPAPEVILEYQKGKFRVALNLMKKPLPPPEQERQLADSLKRNWAAITQQSGDPVPPAIWGHMLDLIYSGHSHEAWKFLDNVWQEDKASKAIFLRKFKQQLTTSKYWSSIKKFM
jgi:hypothetical protein